MKTVCEKFQLHFSIYDLEFLTIRSLRQLRSLRNLYQLDLEFENLSSDTNFVLVSDRKLNAILGVLRCQVSAPGGYLRASERFDTFPIEKMDLRLLEITDFQIAEAAWHRLGFRTALGRGVLNIMKELCSDGLLVHCEEKVKQIDLFVQQFRGSPFRSELVRCGRYQENRELLEVLEPLAVVPDQSVFSMRLNQLLTLGLEIWSDPIVYQNRESISFLLGFIPKRSLAEARPLAVSRNHSKGEQSHATLRLAHSQHME